MSIQKNNSSSYDEIIEKHYAKVARNFGTSSRATMEDPFIRNKETEFILIQITDHIKRFPNKKKWTVLDLGCGNGHLLQFLSENLSENFSFYGIENHRDLFKLAVSARNTKINFIKGDIRKDSAYESLPEIDFIISERVIINILNHQQQMNVLKKIAQILSINGLYIMIECFENSLKNLNKARKENLLPRLNQSKQNLYLKENQLHGLLKYGMIEIDPVWNTHYFSTHYFLTRIIHPLIRPKGGRIKNSEIVQFFNMALPPGVGEYSPLQFKAFTRLG